MSAPAPAAELVITSPNCRTTWLDCGTHNNNCHGANPILGGATVRVETGPQGVGRVGLIRFDFHAVFPAGVKAVHKAKLRLHVVGPNRGQRTFQFHRITSDWYPGDSYQLPARGGVDSFCRRHPDLQWRTPGGDYLAEPFTSVDFNQTAGELILEIEMPANEIEFAINHPSESFGWMIRQTTSDPVETSFCSARNRPESRPQLTVVYDPVPEDAPRLLVVKETVKHPHHIDLDLPRAGPTNLAVYDAAGRLVRSLWYGREASAGPQHVGWDGCDDAGNELPAGQYSFKALIGGSVKAKYIATPGNGRYPSQPGDAGGIHGLLPKDILTDDNGNIYTLATGHGRGGQKLTPDGDVVWTYRNRWDELGSAFDLDGNTLYVAGPKSWWRVNAADGQLQPLGKDKPNVPLGALEKVSLDPADPRSAAYLGAVTIVAKPRFPIDATEMLDGTFGEKHPMRTRGLTVIGDTVHISLYHENQIRLYDKHTGTLQDTWLEMLRPAGLAADTDGTLLVITAKQLCRFSADGDKMNTIVAEGLVDPWSVAVGPRGYYVIDLGYPNQLKIYDRNGKLLTTYGDTGPFNGLISERKLYVPLGLDVDSDGNIYLAEDHINRFLVLRPDLTVKLSIAGGAYVENVCVDRARSETVYALVGYGRGALREYEIDYDTGLWNWTRYWMLSSRHPTRTVWGFNCSGSKVWTIDGHRLYYDAYKSVRIFNINGDSLRPVAWLGWRFKITDADGKDVPFKSAWPLWTDLNHDGLAQEDEVTYLSESLGRKLRQRYMADAEITSDGTIYYNNFALPLQGIDENGVPHYSWDTVQIVGPDFANMPPVRDGVAVDEHKNRYFSLQFNDGNNRSQPGPSLVLGGHWARNTIDAKLEKWTPDNNRVWRVGARATGYCYPGEFYHPAGIDYAAGYLFINDAPGLVHVYDTDGLFVATLMQDPFRTKTRPAYHYTGRLPLMLPTVGEFWQMGAYVHPKTGRVYLICQSHEGGGWARIYEVTGLDEVVKFAGAFDLPGK